MSFGSNTKRIQLQQQLALVDVLLRGSIYSTTASANELDVLDYSGRAGLRYREPRVFTYEFEASKPNGPESSLQNLISGFTDDQLDTLLHDIYLLISCYLQGDIDPARGSNINEILDLMMGKNESDSKDNIQKKSQKKIQEIDIDID